MIGNEFKLFQVMSIVFPYLLNEVNIKMEHSLGLVAEPITAKAHAHLVRSIEQISKHLYWQQSLI